MLKKTLKEEKKQNMITFGVDIQDMLADMFSKLTITEVTNKELTIKRL